MTYIEDKTETELVDDAGSRVIGTESGLKAQFAQAELTRRLMESIKNLDNSTARYSQVLVGLTLAILVIGYLQLVWSVFASPYPQIVQFFVGAMLTAVIGIAIAKIEKDFW
ncbi:MAG: hypothetical protein UU67_C0078G0004 [Candidatus Daviesbacteria bacterium GW2011_GWB1_41_5]|uniref:Uncharacterized protein n=1 Tax=Candidatus Daviesbacteria bacterium GW2011_GWB1_41_5 TaxID=1618429 RepID=A0A0G0WEA7_9BACT|nr:MAG: hypothetical protein UU67_C0078G0004 [Candidatus Daviesbacteria bacterium GW2011_GWB1_41_5]